MKTILDEGDEVKFKSYCLKHSKSKSGDAGLSPARSKPPGEAGTGGQRAQRLQELEEEFYTLIQLEELAQALGLSQRLVDFIYQYWKLKRKSNFNKALLPPKEEEENMVLQPQEDSIHTRMRMFMHLRQDLERVGAFLTLQCRDVQCSVSVFNTAENVQSTVLGNFCSLYRFRFIKPVRVGTRILFSNHRIHIYCQTCLMVSISESVFLLIYDITLNLSNARSVKLHNISQTRVTNPVFIRTTCIVFIFVLLLLLPLLYSAELNLIDPRPQVEKLQQTLKSLSLCDR